MRVKVKVIEKVMVRVRVKVKVMVKVNVPPEEGSTSVERCRGSSSPPGPGSAPDARAPTPRPGGRRCWRERFTPNFYACASNRLIDFTNSSLDSGNQLKVSVSVFLFPAAHLLYGALPGHPDHSLLLARGEQLRWPLLLVERPQLEPGPAAVTRHVAVGPGHRFPLVDDGGLPLALHHHHRCRRSRSRGGGGGHADRRGISADGNGTAALERRSVPIGGNF